jgi:hypothetical protein
VAHPRPELRIIDRLVEEAGIQVVSRWQNLSEKGNAPQSQAQSCGECSDGRRAGAYDPRSRVGQKRLSMTEIYATVAPVLVKEAYDMHGFGRSPIL